MAFVLIKTALAKLVHKNRLHYVVRFRADAERQSTQPAKLDCNQIGFDVSPIAVARAKLAKRPLGANSLACEGLAISGASIPSCPFVV